MARTYSNRFSMSVVQSLGLPDWVPAPGTIANVSQNTIFNVQPCAANNCNYSGGDGINGMFAYCGGAFLAEYGNFGALAQWGGGHDVYYGNEVYLFDLETRLWSRRGLYNPGGALQRTPASAWGSNGGPYGRGDPNLINGNLKGDDNLIDSWGCYDADPRQPATVHTDYAFVGLPQKWGGGAQGSFVKMGGYSAGHEFANSNGQSRFDIATDQWGRIGNNLPPVQVFYAPICFDDVNGKFYSLLQGQGSVFDEIQIFDCTTRNWTQVSTPNGFSLWNTTTFPTLTYVPTLNCIMGFWRDSTLDSRGGATTIRVYTIPVTNFAQGWTERTANTTTGFSFNKFPSVTWSPLLGKFGVYHAMADNFVDYLQPPSTINGTWIWSRETFGGTAALPTGLLIANDGYSPYNRFNWVEKLRSFSWVSFGHQAVQLFRPAGT